MVALDLVCRESNYVVTEHIRMSNDSLRAQHPSIHQDGKLLWYGLNIVYECMYENKKKRIFKGEIAFSSFHSIPFLFIYALYGSAKMN